MDQGDYFDTVLKPRVQKVVYSADWQEGVPTAPDTGLSHCFKVLKIESYEDTLNNLALERSEAQGALLDRMGQEARDDYRSPQEEWSAIRTAQIDAMVRLDKAMRSRVQSLKL